MKNILCVLSLTLLLLGGTSAKSINTVKVEVLTKTNLSWDGKELPAYEKGKPEISILKIIIPPGENVPLHKHPVINAGVLLRGKLTVVTDDNTMLYLKAGDTIVEALRKE